MDLFAVCVSKQLNTT